jgi:hypothetical protein
VHMANLAWYLIARRGTLDANWKQKWHCTYGPPANVSAAFNDFQHGQIGFSSSAARDFRSTSFST